MNILAQQAPAPRAYVLAVLEDDDALAVSHALHEDAELAQATWAQEEALVPLAATLKPRRPPTGLREALNARLFDPVEADLKKARRRARFWRRACGLFALVALILAVVVGLVATGVLASP